MLLNYFLLSFRNLKKQRGYTIVNTLGLAIGLASAIFIFLYVRDELTFDNFHPKAAETYRIGYRLEFPNGEAENNPFSPAGWDNYIKETYTGITDISSFTSQGMPTTIANEEDDRIVLTEEIIWAEPNINKILSVEYIKGNTADPLKEINSITLSTSAATELFGDEDPINKIVTVSHQWMTEGKKIDMMVTAVYADIPSNSHIRPKYICNVLALKVITPTLENLLNTAMGDNDNYWTQSFFVCTDESKIPAIQEDLQKRANAIIARFNLNFKFKPIIRKITDVHFDQEVNWAIEHKSADRTYIFVFISIAILILVVACINYINLSTARSANRAREIGLRKTFGGIRLQLFVQFMIESFMRFFFQPLWPFCSSSFSYRNSMILRRKHFQSVIFFRHKCSLSLAG